MLDFFDSLKVTRQSDCFFALDLAKMTDGEGKLA